MKKQRTSTKDKCRNCGTEFRASHFDDLLCSEVCAKEWDARMFEKRLLKEKEDDANWVATHPHGEFSVY